MWHVEPKVAVPGANMERCAIIQLMEYHVTCFMKILRAQMKGVTGMRRHTVVGNEGKNGLVMRFTTSRHARLINAFGTLVSRIATPPTDSLTVTDFSMRVTAKTEMTAFGTAGVIYAIVKTPNRIVRHLQNVMHVKITSGADTYHP
mmetsp:Transcript_37881/g.52865  ORF Transcript_37881/g.52865 Transcript_37881/m.52865 type:complete len:146 (-) Transcript_37881:190-627(-)